LIFAKVKLENLFHHSQLEAPQGEKNPGALGTCPVCPLVKTALMMTMTNLPFFSTIAQRDAGVAIFWRELRDFANHTPILCTDIAQLQG